MRDKEKQIKLLTKRISKIQNKGVKDIPNFTNIFIDNQELAEEILKYYQLKLPKDSVVLSKEEYKNLKHYENEMYRLQGVVDTLTNEGWDILDEKEEKIRKTQGKETAEKVITKIKQSLSSIETIRGDDTNKLQPEIGYSMREVDDLLDELAKQFHVEIREKK